ncbi:hypothetical protein CANINC_000876 [Pichia inconspicua]|uniref:Uncharacterized protein n=1 Tax=Pichia inconspicua TaxID=52247 RepID=A0A4T0X5G2_9ASCO|nr:hypothetical protein CANINC_000876 [[Candida] inconspicua]
MLLKTLLQIALTLIFTSPSTANQPNLNESFLLLGDFNAISIYNSIETLNITSPPSNSIGVYQLDSNTITKLEANNLPAIPSLWYPLDDFKSLMIVNNKPYIYNINETNVVELRNWNNIDGEIKTVYYDHSQNIFYFGGSLAFNETHGVVQYDDLSEQLSTLPFGGFDENSSVNTITKDETTENILFGGSFNSIGYPELLDITFNETITNTTIVKNDSSIIDISQKVPIFPSDVVATGGVNAQNIICPTDEQNGWRLDNGELGSWTATIQNTINPSKLRLYNSASQSHGVKTFRVISYPAGSIMNLSYIDPSDLSLKFCEAFCPLFQNSEVESSLSANNITNNTYYTFTNNNQTILELTNEFQDFAFVNHVDIKSFTVQILEYYGDYAQLDGIELSADGINIYANEQFNNLPSCASSNALDINVNSQSIGGVDWLQSANGDYMYSTIATDELNGTKGMRFNVQLAVSGEYNVLMNTVGCLEDNSCANRGIVNVTLYNSKSEVLSNNIIYQTNQYKKYDVLYTGRLEVDYPDNKPLYVEMTVIESLNGNYVYAVADSVQLQYIQLDLNEVTGEITRNQTVETEESVKINSLFEYSVKNFTNNVTYPIANTTFNLLGLTLSEGAIINQLLINDTSIIIAGDFASPFGDNIFGTEFKPENTQLNITDYFTIGGGSNGEVNYIYGPVDEFAIFGDFDKFTNLTNNNDGAVLFNSNSNQITNLNITNVDSFNSVSGFMYNETEYLTLTDNSSSVIYDLTNNNLFENTTIFGMNVLAALDSNNDEWMLEHEFTKSLVLGHITQFQLAANNIVNLSNDTASIVQGNSDAILNAGIYMDNDTFVVAGSNIYTVVNNSISLLSDQLTLSQNSQINTLLNYKDTLFFSINGTATYNSDNINGFAALSMNTFSLMKTLNEEFNGTINDIAIDPEFGNIIGVGSFSVGDCVNVCIFGNDSTALTIDRTIAGVSGTLNSLNYYDAYKVLIAGDFSYEGDHGYIGVYDTFDNDITMLSNFSTSLPGGVTGFTFADEEKELKTLSDVIVVHGVNYVGFFNNTKYTSISDSINFENGELTNIALVETSSTGFFQNTVIIATGRFTIKNYGLVSSAIWDGVEWTPYTITANNLDVNNAKAQKLVRKASPYIYQGPFPKTPSTPGKLLNKETDAFTNGQVVGVGFALALGTVLLLSGLGFAYYFLSGTSQKEHLDGLKLVGDDKLP